MSDSRFDARSRPSRGKPRRRAAGKTAQAPLEAILAEPVGNPIRRALWLDALDLRLRPCLPPSLAAHARLANISGNKLVFLVDAPVWHAKLRLAETQLLDAARSIGLEAGAVAIKIATTPLHPPRPQAPAAGNRSPAARDGLRAAMALLREPSWPSDPADGDRPAVEPSVDPNPSSDDDSD